MLVLTRHRVTGDPAAFLEQARTALSALAARPGYVTGSIGRAADDAELWVLATRWLHVGAYRRALSAYEVKVDAVPLLSTAVDEPTAFEVLADVAGEAQPGSEPRGRSDLASDAGSIGLGSASAPSVRSDLPGTHGRPGPVGGAVGAMVAPAAVGVAARSPYTELPAHVDLAETSTTHDTSVADSVGSFGAVSTSWPRGVAIGPEGAGDGD